MADNVVEMSVPLAIMDFVPVALFFINCILVGINLKRVHLIGGIIFSIGGFISFVGGFFQAFWKLMILLIDEDISIFHAQFKFSLPLGFLFMLIAILVSWKKIQWKAVKSKLLSFPCIIFVVLTIICLIAMLLFLIILKSNKLKSIYIKESVNIVFQASISLCALLALRGRNTNYNPKNPKNPKTESEENIIKNTNKTDTEEVIIKNANMV